MSKYQIEPNIERKGGKRKITRPTKKQVESLVGKEVTITLFDKSVHRGILDKTESNLSRYGHPSRYHVNGNLIFRSSHIEKIVTDWSEE